MPFVWSPEDDAVLIAGINARESQTKIAAKLGTVRSEIQNRVYHLRRQNILPIPVFDRPRIVSICEVQRVVCETFGITQSELISARRSPKIVKPRHIAMALSYKLSGHSTTIVGEKFGRDHSTIIHAVRVANERYPQELARVESRILEAKKAAAA